MSQPSRTMCPSCKKDVRKLSRMSKTKSASTKRFQALQPTQPPCPKLWRIAGSKAISSGTLTPQ